MATHITIRNWLASPTHTVLPSHLLVATALQMSTGKMAGGEVFDLFLLLLKEKDRGEGNRRW